MTKKYKAEIVFELGIEDFKHCMGRKPNSQEEWDDFVHYTERGVEAQLDWSIINECTKEAMKYYKK